MSSLLRDLVFLSAVCAACSGEHGSDMARPLGDTIAHEQLAGDDAQLFAEQIAGTYKDKPAERSFFFFQIVGYLELAADGTYRKTQDLDESPELEAGRWTLDTTPARLPAEPAPVLDPVPAPGEAGPSPEEVAAANAALLAEHQAPRALLSFLRSDSDSVETVIVKIMGPSTLLLVDGNRKTRIYRQH